MRTSLCLSVLLVASMSAQTQYDALQRNSLAVIGTTAVQKPIGCKDNLAVERTANHWYVKNLNTGTSHFVQKADVDKQLRNISPEQFARLIQLGKGYIALNQYDDGSYTLQHRARLRGGGPWTAYILYGTTKGVAYGTMATAVGATVAGAAGPVVGAYATGAGAYASGMTAGSAGSAVASSGTAAATAAGAASTGAAGATGAALGGAGAQTATASAIASTGGCWATLTGAVESAAWGAFAVGLWLPTP